MTDARATTPTPAADDGATEERVEDQPVDDAADHRATAAPAAPTSDAEIAATTEPEPTAPDELATFIPVQVMTVAYDLAEPSPTIHLREDDPPFRGIIFPVGLPEAQAIARALEGDRPARPSTHELFATVLAAAACDLVAVRITAAKEGTLIAELDLIGPRGREVVDCRPTDGIALALRAAVRAPILCEVSLLE